jgi:hypothetical protein
MKINIFLDDIRIPLSDDWLIVKNYNKFVEIFNTPGFTLDDVGMISLDHDLGETVNEKTGYDVAKWLVQLSLISQKNLPFIQVHSANPVGANNIIKYINGYLRSQDMEETCVKTFVPLKRGIKLEET